MTSMLHNALKLLILFFKADNDTFIDYSIQTAELVWFLSVWVFFLEPVNAGESACEFLWD